ncbi:MAG: alpha/beta hydrolase [Armatimonadota bacterium]
MNLRSHVRLLSVMCFVLLAAGCNLSAQQAPTVQTDVVYGVADGQDLKLDVYPCATPGPHPAALLIHGGGWAAGSKSGEANTGINLSRNGVVAFAVEYRFAPQYPWPAQILDCARAARWVRAHAAEYGVDTSRLGAMGGSAGGHLSLMLGVIKPDDYQSPDDPNRALSAKVTCVVDLFGPTDMRGASFSPGATGILKNFIGAPPGEAQDKYADCSPITHATKEASPVLFVHGDADTLVPLQQSQVMKAKLDELGVENELIVVKNGGHGFGGASDKDKSDAWVAMGHWLLAHLK